MADRGGSEGLIGTRRAGRSPPRGAWGVPSGPSLADAPPPDGAKPNYGWNGQTSGVITTVTISVQISTGSPSFQKSPNR